MKPKTRRCSRQCCRKRGPELTFAKMEFPWRNGPRWYCPNCFQAFMEGCASNPGFRIISVEDMDTGEITQVHPEEGQA